MDKKPKLKELKGVVNDLLELDYRISSMKWLLFNLLASAKVKDFELNLLTGKMVPPKKDDLGKMYKEKYEWFIARIKKLDLLKDISSAKLTLINGIETIRIETKDKRIFEKTK